MLPLKRPLDATIRTERQLRHSSSSCHPSIVLIVFTILIQMRPYLIMMQQQHQEQSYDLDVDHHRSNDYSRTMTTTTSRDSSSSSLVRNVTLGLLLQDKVCGSHHHYHLNDKNKNNNQQTSNHHPDWAELCNNGIVAKLNQALLWPLTTSSSNQPQSQHVYVIQIGAHIGFEKNDPIGHGLLQYLQWLPDAAPRARFHWVFVEPSPPNFARLQANVKQYESMGATMTLLNAAVVAEEDDDAENQHLASSSQPQQRTFYSIRDTIDPTTGYDTLSGKTFPPWITQISSFRMAPIRFNRAVWTKLGLHMRDYIVETNVTTFTYPALVRHVMQNVPNQHPSNHGGNGNSDDASSNQNTLALVLIDTEGLDCEIVKGMGRRQTTTTTTTPQKNKKNNNKNHNNDNDNWLPQFLVFEHNQCGANQRDEALRVLRGNHYKVAASSSRNTIATRLL